MIAIKTILSLVLLGLTVVVESMFNRYSALIGALSYERWSGATLMDSGQGLALTLGRQLCFSSVAQCIDLVRIEAGTSV